MRLTVLWLTAILCAVFVAVGLVISYFDRRNDR